MSSAVRSRLNPTQLDRASRLVDQLLPYSEADIILMSGFLGLLLQERRSMRLEIERLVPYTRNSHRREVMQERLALLQRGLTEILQ